MMHTCYYYVVYDGNVHAAHDEPSAKNEHTINISLNGERINITSGVSVLGLMNHMKLPDKNIAVERNLEIVPKSCWNTTILEEGDRLEIVRFVGGG